MSETAEQVVVESNNKRWVEVFTPVVIALVLGAGFVFTMKTSLDVVISQQDINTAELKVVSQAVLTMGASVNGFQVSLERDRELQELKLQQALTSVKQKLVEVSTRAEVYDRNFHQIWPRLRALDKNATILQRGLERAGQKVELEHPQKF